MSARQHTRFVSRALHRIIRWQNRLDRKLDLLLEAADIQTYEQEDIMGAVDDLNEHVSSLEAAEETENESLAQALSDLNDASQRSADELTALQDEVAALSAQANPDVSGVLARIDAAAQAALDQSNAALALSAAAQQIAPAAPAPAPVPDPGPAPAPTPDPTPTPGPTDPVVPDPNPDVPPVVPVNPDDPPVVTP